jgi:hypothetical protein
MAARVAACSCGQLTAAATGDPVRISICHCLACQQRTGSAFGAQARFAAKDVVISGRSTSWVRIGDAGTAITFRFCPDCGSTVYYTMAGFEEVIAIPLGAFADPSFPAPSFSVYEERKHAWIGLPQAMQHEP